MGYVRIDTSDDLMSRQDAAWLFALCRDLQRSLRPLDFALHLYATSAAPVPHAETPRYVINVLIYVEGIHGARLRELSFYTRPRFAKVLRQVVDEALH